LAASSEQLNRIESAAKYFSAEVQARLKEEEENVQWQQLNTERWLTGEE